MPDRAGFLPAGTAQGRNRGRKRGRGRPGSGAGFPAWRQLHRCLGHPEHRDAGGIIGARLRADRARRATEAGAAAQELGCPRQPRPSPRRHRLHRAGAGRCRPPRRRPRPCAAGGVLARGLDGLGHRLPRPGHGARLRPGFRRLLGAVAEGLRRPGRPVPQPWLDRPGGAHRGPVIPRRHGGAGRRLRRAEGAAPGQWLQPRATRHRADGDHGQPVVPALDLLPGWAAT